MLPLITEWNSVVVAAAHWRIQGGTRDATPPPDPISFSEIILRRATNSTQILTRMHSVRMHTAGGW